MAMHNTDRDFYGKQTDEKILYVVRPHPLATTFGLLKIYSVAVIISLVLIILGTEIQSLTGLFVSIALILFVLIIVVGTKVVLDWQTRNISYITDRRLVHFEPTTLFATNSRTLAWDEVVKIKTFPPNVVWKQLAIGNVVVHARTPVHPSGEDDAQGISVDDIELKSVYLYRDLGNYIDKILYTYKQRPAEIADIRPFIPRARGERY
ncbi:MAG TPA: hypothetical protein VKC53_03715 [Patescibacteria group bacterium]|nr:hypothetical protein [Patescibacteria group bacterium]